MSSRTLTRLSGISLFIGSLFLIIGTILGFFSGNSQVSTIATTSSLTRLIGSMLVVLGLPGIYARFAEQSGVIGVIGFISTFFLFLIGMASESILVFIFPFLGAHGLLGGGRPPLGLLIFYSFGDLLGLIGGILLGIAVMRATILPRWAGVLLIVGGLFYAIGSLLRLPVGDVGLIIFTACLGWLAVGIVLKQPDREEVVYPLPGVHA